MIMEFYLTMDVQSVTVARQNRGAVFSKGKRMLVEFKSDAGNMTMFGDVAVSMLKMMGQTGALPGALLAKDVPAALERLKRGAAVAPAARPAPVRARTRTNRRCRSSSARFRSSSCSNAA
jgi:hypothetical protein